MLHARTIRAPMAGRITGMHLDFDPRGFVLADHRDIPGKNVVALIEDDQPLLAVEHAEHAEEAVLLVAHADEERLHDVNVRIDIGAIDPVLDAEQSRHVFKTIRIAKGDLAKGFDKADRVFSGEYRTGHQEQLYIEPNGVIAVPEDGGLTIYGSLQCPYYVHKAMVVATGLAPDKIRIIQAETGGGFGGKEDYPSVIAGHAAILALKARRPVKMVYDRVEDMAATTKRHPSVVRHKTGVTKDGKLVAMEIDVLMDGGAYCTLSPVVLSRGVLHAAGAYRCEHVRIHGRTVKTNTPPNGAFRGFGAPQTVFAIEAHMDRIADELGIDPVALREKNAYRPGDTTPTGQKLGADTSALMVLKEAVKRTDFVRRRKALKGTNRGLGLALFPHGAGFTGAGEVKLKSKASLALTRTGAEVRVASTEIGQGTRTMLAQIVADTLGWPYETIDVSVADTGVVPDSGPTVASRTCMVVGGILARCAKELKRRLGTKTPARYLDEIGPLLVTESYEKPAEIEWDDDTYRGDAYGTYAWGCDVIELELDPVTYEARPIMFTAVQEIGKAIHPLLARGQIEGGSLQGLGYALCEEVVMRGGKMANAQLTNYIIPTTLDTPPMDVAILENPYHRGPFGAKGVGELPMSGPGPAVVNALRHLGVRLNVLPATPERIQEVLCGSR